MYCINKKPCLVVKYYSFVNENSINVITYWMSTLC